jgi:MFS family permease
MADAFRLSGILGVLMGLFCFTLPHTPPRKGRAEFATGEAIQEIKRNPLLTLFLVTFPIACIHQFYFMQTAGFVNQLQFKAPFIDAVFGVGGGGLMTIGQMAEIAVLALMPVIATKASRKALLATGIAAYISRFAVFAYFPSVYAVIPALALHGVCFGCFFFIAFIVVDENTTADVRASSQSLYNFVVLGLGITVGSLFSGWVEENVKFSDGRTDYRTLFSIPMWIAVGCLIALMIFYPAKKRT